MRIMITNESAKLHGIRKIRLI